MTADPFVELRGEVLREHVDVMDAVAQATPGASRMTEPWRKGRAMTYFDHYAGQTSRQPGDLVEMDPYIVLEGEAAEDTIRRFYDAAIRAAEAVQ